MVGLKSILRLFVVPRFVVWFSGRPAYSCSEAQLAKLRDDIELPPDYSLVFKLGPSARSTIRGSNALIVGTSLNAAELEVVHNLKVIHKSQKSTG